MCGRHSITAAYQFDGSQAVDLGCLSVDDDWQPELDCYLVHAAPRGRREGASPASPGR